MLAVREYRSGRPLCMCGCGRPVGLALQNHSKAGHVKGQPYRYARGHKTQRRTPLRERLLERIDVDEETGCWNFTGYVERNGYGRISLGGRHSITWAHRAAWIEFRGLVPDGLELDHLCCNTRCCNPDHLEPVTHAENMRRWAERRRAAA